LSVTDGPLTVKRIDAPFNIERNIKGLSAEERHRDQLRNR
jgi:hypothetical protein